MEEIGMYVILAIGKMNSHLEDVREKITDLQEEERDLVDLIKLNSDNLAKAWDVKIKDE